VFGEAEKDRCFGRAGWRKILADPVRFVALVRASFRSRSTTLARLATTCTRRTLVKFDELRRLRMGLVETVWERLVLLAAIVQAARRGLARRRLRQITAAAAGYLHSPEPAGLATSASWSRPRSWAGSSNSDQWRARGEPDARNGADARGILRGRAVWVRVRRSALFGRTGRG